MPERTGGFGRTRQGGTTAWLVAFVTLSAAAGALGGATGCEDKPPIEGANDSKGKPKSSSSAKAKTEPTVTSEPSASTTASAPEPPTSSTPTPSASAVTSVVPSATVSAAPSAIASAPPGPKTFECGGKGQKACPMEGWMKSVMASATASGDGEKLAKALNTVASKPVPGFGQWVAISQAGAAKAAAGDIDGAKESCKKCHALYKDTYVKTMRDRPW